MANTDDSENGPPDGRRMAADSSSTSSEPVEICTGCHQPLVRRGPKGECLRCLMAFVFPPEDEETIGASSSEELAGKSGSRYGHFEIDTGSDGHPVELGAGAMATTYRAQDSVLHSAVALKVINQKVAEHPSARARFLREARAAAKLHHPNVASVSHYGEQNGECYYVMELVEGETLEARVRREGPLPPALVLEIGVQVARALAAAEACGVVHRDLKPSNIMLTTSQGEKTGSGASTVVKVIDWGLAKAVSAESALGTDHTHGGFVGTPAFASPEQFSRAEDRRIDARSDIYSLGVTLWYLLCGRTPFTGTTLEEIHVRQVEHPMPLVQLAAARVPARIVSLLKSMLAIDPATRPQSARELLDALRACQEHFPVERASRRTRRERQRRWAVAALVFVACTVAALAAQWCYLRLPSAPAGISVAVLPLENLSPEGKDAFFAAGMQDAITADLAQIAQLKVIDPSSVKSYTADKPRDLAAIGHALGIDHLLEGSVRRDGDRVRIVLRLTDLQHPMRKWTTQYERPLAEEFGMLSEITLALAGRLRTVPTPLESSAINLQLTHDPVAYDLYLQAGQGPNIFRDAQQLREHDQKRIDLLNAAVARDPGFALAYCKLSSLHDSIYAASRTSTDAQEMEDLTVDHRALAESALVRARNLQPDSGELHLRQAHHYYLITRDYEQARLETELARRTLPNSAVLESIAGRIALHQGRGDDAIRMLRRAVELNPRDLAIRGFLEEAYGNLRRDEEADREVTAMLSMLPPQALPVMRTGRALHNLAGQADVKPLRAAVAAITDDADPDHEMRDEWGLLLALFSHDAEGLRYQAASMKEQTAMIADFRYPLSWFVAIAARMRHDEAGARAAFMEARAVTEKTVSINPLNERSLLLLAMIDAGLGRKEDAVREAQRACAMVPLEADKLVGPCNRCCLAVVYAWTDQPDLAFTELEKLVAGPSGVNFPNQPTYGDFKLNPLWDPLRGDPRFDALVQHLAPADSRP